MRTPTSSPSFSIIIPTFNEAGGIAACVQAVAAVCNEDYEILVIDGGSDQTETILRELSNAIPRLRYIKNEADRGKGHAIRRGISEARGRAHAQFDADLQFMPEDIPMLIQKVASADCDVALGSRFTPNSQKDLEASLMRKFGNWSISAYASLLFGQRMTDVLAGIKAWSAHAATVIDLQSDDFAYEVEIPARAIQRGLRVREYPIGTCARTSGESKVSIIASGSSIVSACTRFRLTQ
jgi:glycosyltransferase involved in cell wall biosynthesis